LAEQPNINAKTANTGIVLDNVTSQIPQGALSWAVNAVISSFDGKQITYSNEQGNLQCVTWPKGYRPIGIRNILEEDISIAWLLNPKTEDCEIGIVKNCKYNSVINSKCLNFSIKFPILKHAHRNTNCGLEIYWVDGRNNARFIQLEKLPYQQFPDPNSCGFITNIGVVDCNKLNLQPNFSIPQFSDFEVNSGGTTKEGTYQFAVQYANAKGEPYTSYYSITNPIPLYEGSYIGENFDELVNKNISFLISNIDVTGVFDYINVAVIKTINNTPVVELVGTYQIEDSQRRVVYSGIGTPIEQDILEVFQRYASYSTPNDLTVAQDILIIADVTDEERISYQEIANKIHPKWATIRLKGDKDPYSDPRISALYRGYMRDETYPLELVLLLDNGYQTDRFILTSREPTPYDLEFVNNDDVPVNTEECETPKPKRRYEVYNTASSIGFSHPANPDDCYEGEWEYGEFAYVESTETFPCNPMYGDMQGKPIRHFKFPDCNITHIHDNEGYIYPIGIKIDVQEVWNAIQSSSLSQQQKDRIKGFKIVRGNRGENNISIAAKGLINNVLKYSTENNIIDASTGEAAGASSTGPEDSTRGILNNALEFTKKGHKESNAYAFLNIIGTITVGKNYEQNKRYNRAERIIEDVLGSSDLFTEENASKLNTAISVLDDIIANSGGDARGKAHAQGAKALLEGAVQVIEAQIDLIESLNSIDTTAIASGEENKFAYFPNYLFNDVRTDAITGKPKDFFLDNTIIDGDAKQRYTLHSPDTSFYQPRLGNILKLETAEFGTSSGHIVQTKNHAKYQFISPIGYITALLAGVTIGFGSGSYGIGSVNVFNGQAMFTAYQAFLDILYKTVPHKNFAHQFNAIGRYTSFKDVPNEGNKQRVVDIATYLSPGMLNVRDKYTVNNYERESSIYLRTTKPLPYTHEIAGVPQDSSKLAAATFNIINTPISSYYASLKNNIPNQWGQLYSYSSVDTGFQKMFDDDMSPKLIFGGDVFINRFAYKSKIPFFLDNRVNPNNSSIIPDGSDISYNELSNVGRVKYWFSTDVTANTSFFDSFFATMTHNFFWPKIHELYLDGMIFLFAYGIPYFYCESTVNVDLRKAINARAGDYYPRVASGIPDDWLQETNVTIQQDNSYNYNKTFSKQNTENEFTYIPSDYDFNICRRKYPFRAIFSEQATDSPNPSNRNNWRIFKPAAKFDFPQNYGKLISLDGIESKQVLARFENKTLLYNALLTAPTSNGEVYLGSSLFSQNVPPYDYPDSEAGRAGTRNKMLIRTEFGHISVDAKRGDILLFQGRDAKDITTGISAFCSEFFDFQIDKHFDISVDNPFYGVGFHGVYDKKYERAIITKLDYKPIVDGIKLEENGVFVLNGKPIELTDTRYFCNLSLTLSYSFKTGTWISFHTYLPNYYVVAPNEFYSGNAESLWKHDVSISKFNNFYGKIHPYILEYAYQYSFYDEILQNVQNYSNVLKYESFREFYETDEYFFNKFIAWNNQQSSGLIEMVPSPKNNLFLKKQYPKYNSGSKTILVSKSGSFYNIHTFWDMIKDVKKPVWKSSCENLSIYKELNDDNHDYSKRSFNKAPIRAKDLKLRFILDDRDDIQIISGFTIAPTATSFK